MLRRSLPLVLAFILLGAGGALGQTADLTVSITGTGATFPAPGTYTYDVGDQVTVLAFPTAGSGYAFQEWQGDISSNLALLQFTIEENTALDALFVTPGDHTLTVTQSGAGSGTLIPGTGSFSYLDSTTAFARVIPDAGSYFGGWSGAATGYTAIAPIFMDGDKSLDANLTTSGYELTVQVDGVGQTNPPPSTTPIADGAEVTLTAFQTDPNWNFSEWQGDIGSATATDPSITVTMDQARTVTAVFTESTTYTLTLAVASGSGTTVPGPGTYTYAPDTMISLVAEPDPGFVFTTWIGDIGGADPTSDTIDITMDQDRSIGVVFEAADYQLTLSVAGTGDTTPVPGTYDYLDGDTVQVSAVETDPLWRFQEWTGDIGTADSTNPVLDLTMDQPRNVTAVFEEASLTLTVATDGPGSTAPAAGSYPQFSGDAVTVRATPDAGKAFDRWEGDIGGADANDPVLTVTMDMDRSVTAYFVEPDHTVTITTSGAGSTVPPAGTYGFVDGRTATVNAVPDDETSAFQEWTGDISSTSRFISFTVDSDISIEAVFVASNHVLTVSHTGSGTGITNPDVGSHGYLDGEIATVNAVPDAGSYFGGWQGDVTGFNPVIDILMDADTSITAAFEDSGYDLVIGVTGAAGGTTDPAPGTYAFADNATPVISAIVTDLNWRFAGWTGDIGGVDPNTLELPVTMDQARTVTANFEEIPEYTLTVEIAGNGTTNPPLGTYTYTEGETVTLSASPDSGNAFDGWTGDIGGANPSASSIDVVMDQNRTITANFSPVIQRELTIAVSGSGSTTPAAGTYTYLDGAEVTIGATADSGWVFDSWSGDIGGADPNTTPLVVNMDQARSITATFTQEAPANHAADQDGNLEISLSELLRVIQFYNSDGLHCQADSEDGYAPGPTGDQTCTPHSSDYNPQDWVIDLSELLRLIQFYNSGGYYPCPENPDSEDGFCVGTPPVK